MHILLKTLTGCRRQLHNGSTTATNQIDAGGETSYTGNESRGEERGRGKGRGRGEKGLRPPACRWCWRRPWRLRRGWQRCPPPPGWRSSTRSGTASSEARTFASPSSSSSWLWVLCSLLLPSGQPPSPPLPLYPAASGLRLMGRISIWLGQNWGV